MANTVFPVHFGLNNGFGPRLISHITSGRSRWLPGLSFWWYPGRAITYLDFTAAATSEEIDLNVIAGSGNEFPANVLVQGSFLQVDTLISGGSIAAATASLGDTGAPTQLQNAVNVFTGQATGLRSTLGTGLDNGPVLETAYVPVLTIATGAEDVNTATAGAIWPFILFTPIGVVE